MAKDPAFLFYPGDWQGGTSTFSRFIKGCYLDLLIAQFNSGHLSLEEIKTVLGSDFGQSWPTLQKKFKKDNDGLFFNEKLDTEIVKRKEYSKSRSDNRKGKTYVKDMSNTSKTYVPHMENGNGIEDVNGFKNKKEFDFKKPDVDGENVIFPIDSPAMRDLWAAWKEARWHNYELRYGMHGEQADLARLQTFTFHEIQATIQQAIAGKWKNLYPTKNTKQNGNSGNKKEQHAASTAEFIANTYGQKPRGQ